MRTIPAECHPDGLGAGGNRRHHLVRCRSDHRMVRGIYFLNASSGAAHINDGCTMLSCLARGMAQKRENSDSDERKDTQTGRLHSERVEFKPSTVLPHLTSVYGLPP